MSSRPSAWAAFVLACGIAGAVAPGCAGKSKSGDASAPAAEGAPGGASADRAFGVEESGDLDSLERELADAEAALHARGVTLSAPKSATGVAPPAVPAAGVVQTEKDTEDPGQDRCGRICDLQVAVCGLKIRICGLAEEHVGEARYTEVCERATQDCDEATAACESC